MDRRRYASMPETPPGPGCCICAKGFMQRGYNDSRHERIPLVLKCNHSSCESCILARIKMSQPIACGICEEVSPLPPSYKDGDIRDLFPVNAYLLGLWTQRTKDFEGGDSVISFPKKVVKKEKMIMPKKTFKSCTECTGPADCFCESCITAYCHLCFTKVHSAAKILKDHKRVSLIQEPGAVNPRSTFLCSVHHDKKLELFCNKCYVSICSSCLVSEHNGHNLKSIADKNKEFHDEIIASYARVTDVMNNMEASRKKAKLNLKTSSEGSRDPATKEEKIKQHFVRLHAHLELLENDLLHQLNTSTRTASLNSAIDKLSENIDRIKASLTKTKSLMRSDGFGDFQSLLNELRDLESLPCVLIASKNDTDLNCLQIDHSIFSVLDEHIILRMDDAESYQLKTENDAHDEAIEDLPKSVSLEEVKSQLLPPPTVRPSNSSAGILSAEYAVEKSGRASPMFSRCSSSSSLSSNNSFVMEATQLLAPPDDLIVGITFKAFVSHITSPSDFYVQRHGVRRKLDSLQKELRRCGASCYRNKREDFLYQAGQYYMTMYSGDYNWSRCQLLDFVGVHEVKVLYIDYGNHQKISKSSLKPLPGVLAQIPPLAIRCSLINCYPRHDNEWDPKVVSVMSRMLEGRGSSSITIVRKNQLNCLTVKLYKETETNTIDVGEALNFLEFAQCGPAELYMPELENVAKPKVYPAQTILKAKDVQHKSVNITHVVSPGEFYIKFSVPLADFVIMRNNMFRDYTTLDKRKNDSRIVYYPAVGMAVAVANETGYWWRALVVEMLPRKIVKIFLIDDGQTLMVEWDKLRALELKYFKIPPQAYRCSLTDVQPKDGEDWSEEAAALLRTYKDKDLKIASPEFINNHTSVILVHCDTEMDICINALLVREGLAKSVGPYGNIVEYPKVPNVKPCLDSIRNIQGAPFKLTKNSASLKLLPPKPEKIEEILMVPSDDMLIKDPNGQIKLKVTVVKVINPGEFYVTVNMYDDYFKELFKKMNEFYNNIPPNKMLVSLKLEDKCVVKTADGSWKRGVVVKEPDDDNHVQIYLLDEAVDISVSTKTQGILAELDSQFLSKMDCAVGCALGGIVPAGSSHWTLTSISKMQDFVEKYRDNLYMTKMIHYPDENKQKINVLLIGRKKSKPTATTPSYVTWSSLNHELRWEGCAKPDEYTKWDSKGNIIDAENNAMESEVEVLNSLLRCHFHETPEGAVDLSKPIDESPDVVRITWPPAEPLMSMKFMAKVTYVGSNCDIWVQDPLNVTEMLIGINEEATKLCEGTEPLYPPVQWSVGDICLGKFHLDNKWYRAEITKVYATASHHLVKFVDYGNEEYLKDEEIRLADGITIRPLQSHICYFDNLAPVGDTWPASHIDAIHALLVDKHVGIELRRLANGLLGIKSMILSDGKNALDEIVSRRLGVYRAQSMAESKKVTTKSPDSLSIESNSSWATVASESMTNSQNATIVKVDDSRPEEAAASHTSPEEGACSHASPIINWLSIHETEHAYEIPEGGFRLLDIPSEVNEINVEISAILSPDLYMMQIKPTDNEDLKKVLSSYDQLLITMEKEAESQPGLKPPYLYKACCCKFEVDDKWYRAVVVCVYDSSDVEGPLGIQFVDYGNVQITKACDVREMKEEWFSVPVQTIPCLLDGYAFRQDAPEEEAMECLKRVLIDKPFVKAVIKKRQKNLRVELLNEEGVLLYQPLIDSQHLIPTSSD
uniref:RING finger protein 17 n=1 Tax=Lygus hesperus TaxID=30085 RepID=A0A0K8SV12_LYGHE